MKAKSNTSKNYHPPKKKVKSTSSGLFDKTEKYLSNIKQHSLLLFFLLLSLLLTLINFNARISEAHDDALYLEAAVKLVREFPNYFYTANAPFYPMFLAMIYKLFGFKLIVFKIFSTIFQLLSVFFFFKALYNRVPVMVFIPVMFFVSINHHIIYFASMTFTEAMFMFLQSLFFYVTVKLLDVLEKYKNDLKKTYNNWLILGLVVLITTVTRNAAIVIVPSLFMFFWIVMKNKKYALISIASYFVFYLPYHFILKLIWGDKSQFASQSKILLQKDPYDASLGNEDLLGFIRRFFDNTELYLSKRFYQILGLKDELSTNTNGFIALIMWVLLLWGLWLVYKHKKYLLTVIGIYTVSLITLSFTILQARWDQPRIIMVAMPGMLLIYCYWMHHYFKTKFWKNIYFIISVILTTSMFISTTKRGIKNIPILIKNLQGDMYYGYTPDWQNFLKASAWCAEHLPPDSYVASRKAPMSFIYANGKKFFPIYSVIKKDPETNQSNPDSALAFFKENGVTHILLPHLRIDPTKNTGQFINTIHNILAPIQNKYPNALKLIHTEGETEPCYVYEFVYDAK